MWGGVPRRSPEHFQAQLATTALQATAWAEHLPSWLRTTSRQSSSCSTPGYGSAATPWEAHAWATGLLQTPSTSQVGNAALQIIDCTVLTSGAFWPRKQVHVMAANDQGGEPRSYWPY